MVNRDQGSRDYSVVTSALMEGVSVWKENWVTCAMPGDKERYLRRFKNTNYNLFLKVNRTVIWNGAYEKEYFPEKWETQQVQGIIITQVVLLVTVRETHGTRQKMWLCLCPGQQFLNFSWSSQTSYSRPYVEVVNWFCKDYYAFHKSSSLSRQSRSWSFLSMKRYWLILHSPMPDFPNISITSKCDAYAH